VVVYLVLVLISGDFPQTELLPSDRQLVHHGSVVHRCVTNQRLLEIPSSCCRVTGNNP